MKWSWFVVSYKITNPNLLHGHSKKLVLVTTRDPKHSLKIPVSVLASWQLCFVLTRFTYLSHDSIEPQAVVFCFIYTQRTCCSCYSSEYNFTGTTPGMRGSLYQTNWTFVRKEYEFINQLLWGNGFMLLFDFPYGNFHATSNSVKLSRGTAAETALILNSLWTFVEVGK